MSTISGVSSASSAWQTQSNSGTSSTQRGRGPGGRSPEEMFAKVDSDGSGGVDATELQSMLDHISEKSGQSMGDATELLSQMDGNSDGSLSQDELGQGMKDLMPPPPDTMAFAQRRGGGDVGGGGSGDSAQALLSALDTDQSGEVSGSEMQTLIDQLSQTAGSASTSSAPSGDDLVKALDSDGNGSLSSGELQALQGGGSSSATESASGTPGAQAAHGPRGAGGPPPPRGGSEADTEDSSSSSSSTLDPLDTNEDGTVSLAERLAGQQASESSASNTATGADSSRQMMDLAAMAADLLQRFSTLAGSSSNESSSFSAVA